MLHVSSEFLTGSKQFMTNIGNNAYRVTLDGIINMDHCLMSNANEADQIILWLDCQGKE